MYAIHIIEQSICIPVPQKKVELLIAGMRTRGRLQMPGKKGA